MVQTTAKTPPDKTLSYEVLYYKRKNKVHKSKGVSKMDGRLTISPAPSCIVQLVSDDGKEKIYSGVQRDVAKQATDGLNVDDTVVLGQYEVQIVSVLSSLQEHDDENVVNHSFQKSSLEKRSSKPLQPKVKPLSKRLLASSLKPTVQSTTSTLKPMPSKPLWQKNRRPPAQPKKRAANDKRSDDDDDEKASTRTPVPTKLNPLLSKRRKVTSVAHTTTASTTTTTSSCDFPGAIGNVVVPPSICKVLRPHQSEGVAFLWNCLTGQSTALQQAAKDSGTTGTVAGAILADEMVRIVQ